METKVIMVKEMKEKIITENDKVAVTKVTKETKAERTNLKITFTNV